MNERDKELWGKSQQWDSSDDGRGKLKILESVAKFADLIRADEREANAKVCGEMAYVDPQPHHYANAIRTVRARSQP